MRMRAATWLVVVLGVLATSAALVGCNSGRGGGGGGLLAILCSVSPSTVPSGGSQQATVTATATRDGSPAGGMSVVFTTTVGDVDPDVVLTGPDGVATSFFTPPATSGNALVTARVFSSTDPADQATTTCPVLVSGSVNPVLSITAFSAAQVAGLQVTVGYNVAQLDLPAGGAQLLGPLASGDCVTTTNALPGMVTAGMGCPTLRSVSGTEVVRLSFVNRAGFQDADDFIVTCEATDIPGFPVPVTCAKTVTHP